MTLHKEGNWKIHTIIQLCEDKFSFRTYHNLQLSHCVLLICLLTVGDFVRRGGGGGGDFEPAPSHRCFGSGNVLLSDGPFAAKQLHQSHRRKVNSDLDRIRTLQITRTRGKKVKYLSDVRQKLKFPFYSLSFFPAMWNFLRELVQEWFLYSLTRRMTITSGCFSTPMESCGQGAPSQLKTPVRSIKKCTTTNNKLVYSHGTTRKIQFL